MANEQYGVDLDALDQLVKELNQILKDMGGPNNRAKNQTYLPPKALGNSFGEQKDLHNAHTEMQQYIQEKIVKKITDLIDEFGQKSKKTKEAYDDAEQRNKMHH
ncbi:hypothetical protein ACWEQ8_16665 [Streptomyces noursei]|uniref:Uncharacterized protein n=1 Tax=Streptomyces noursei TaxID=1971 RepID=A0A059W905_STRNR|nr:hypothetical protein [Streptomyces noursei]AIA06255.1 hypothetical protein DC74_5805 [Streptomyces noursei]EXU86934.1 hypothetical protein P354_39610 [Streptomyces noursei PD-1]MCE4948331.1 hypothetical protein [Streptomyces noursei]MCZ0971129.1 hypothetical protein [Streptomyces noursei]UWS74726.1 hypothetical protein N1H47_27870 [Streptomyces noursei]